MAPVPKRASGEASLRQGEAVRGAGGGIDAAVAGGKEGEVTTDGSKDAFSLLEAVFGSASRVSAEELGRRREMREMEAAGRVATERKRLLMQPLPLVTGPERYPHEWTAHDLQLAAERRERAERNVRDARDLREWAARDLRDAQDRREKAERDAQDAQDRREKAERDAQDARDAQERREWELTTEARAARRRQGRKGVKQYQDASIGELVDCMNCGATRPAGTMCALCGHPRATTYRGLKSTKRREDSGGVRLDCVQYFGDAKSIEE
jgi:ribosomal protein L32